MKLLMELSRRTVNSKMFWLFVFSVVNLLFMHYYFLFNHYLEWTFLFSYPANFFSVLFDVFFLLSLAVLLCRRRLKGALAVTYAVSLIWSFVNVVYVRFFYTYLPLSAISESVSLQDSLVVSNVLSGFQFVDIFFPVSVLSFVVLYRKTSSVRINKVVCCRFLIMAFISLLMTLLSYSVYHFAHPNCRNNWELLGRRINELLFYVNDGGTPALARFESGSIRTIAYESYDLLATKELTPDEKNLVATFYMDETGRTSHNETPQVQNVIFILLESFLSAPIDLVVDGKEITPFLNSLKKDSCVYYNGKMKSDIACGESGDGQFLYMTGMLPLRHKMTVSMLKGKSLPSLPRLLSDEFHIKHREIIIPTRPSMWQQSDANVAYGIDCTYSYDDIQSFTAGNDVSDESIFRFAADNVKTENEPFFSMILSMSTHSPYNVFYGTDIIKDNSTFPKEYKNYLNTCHYTDYWLGHYINALKEKGLYDHSLIIICADHYAHLDRLKMYGKITDHIPLFIIHGSVDKAKAWNGDFHQIDTFTTLVDLLNLQSKWKGLGHTILSSPYVNSVNDQTYAVSKLLIESDYFQSP